MESRAETDHRANPEPADWADVRLVDDISVGAEQSVEALSTLANAPTKALAYTRLGRWLTRMLIDDEPRVVARVKQLIEQVGEAEFRRGVAQMTSWDTEIRSLDAVIELYVLARRGRVAPPEMGHRAVEAYPTLPDRTDDDLGFRDRDGRAMTAEKYVQWRTDLRATTVVT